MKILLKLTAYTEMEIDIIKQTKNAFSSSKSFFIRLGHMLQMSALSIIQHLGGKSVCSSCAQKFLVYSSSLNIFNKISESCPSTQETFSLNDTSVHSNYV